ncbi:hypothetical protein BH10PSE12_BH10PSE12_34660 [soil metagenome]
MKQGMAFPLDDTIGSGAGAHRFSDLRRDERATALLIAERGARDRVAMMVESAGGRLLGSVLVGEAMARLDRIADVDLIMLHCPSSHPDTLRLLARLEAMMVVNDTRVLVITDLDALDRVYPDVRAAMPLLCDPSDTELAAEIMLGLRARSARTNLCDISKDSDALRLERLSEEVGRLARTLDAMMEAGTLGGGTLAAGARGGGMMGEAFGNRPVTPALANAGAPWLSDRRGGYAGPPAVNPVGLRAGEDLQAGHVRDMLRARRLRDQFLPGDLFADPAWDMMLDLMAARLAGERVSVSSLCIAAAVPPTTALRWIRILTERGIFLREADSADGRRVFIVLSDTAAASIAGWFHACHRVLRG